MLFFLLPPELLELLSLLPAIDNNNATYMAAAALVAVEVCRVAKMLPVQ